MFKTINSISGNSLKPIYLSSLFTVLEAIAAALPYGIICFVLSDLVQGTVNSRLYWLIVGIFFSLLVRLYLSARCHGGMMQASYEITGNIRIRVGEHLRQLSMGFFAGKDLGRLSNFLLKDIKLIDFMFSHIWIRVVHSVAFPLVIVLFLAIIDIRLLLPLLVVIPFALPFVFIGQRSIKKRGGLHLDIVNETDAAVLEYVQGITVMKSHLMTGEKNQKLDYLFKSLASRSFKLEAAAFSAVIGFSVIVEIGFILMLLTGIYLVSEGLLGSITFIIFLVVALRLYAPVFEFIRCFSLMRYMRNAGERVEEVISEKSQAYSGAEYEIQDSDIRFCNVSFRYENKLTLNNINLHIPENKVTALVGPSGSGKSTIMNLIMRLWDIKEGEILLGGVSLKDLSPKRLLANISTVFQEVYLFNDTIKNNIAIGNQDATDNEIFAAAKAAQAHTFIEKLPLGYETVVGEGGKSLSGGEKQRISIARALLKDSPIILLDEATASLDPENEASIQKAIDRLVISKTVVVIAHRLNTVVKADQIVVLDAGNIVESGSHEELIGKGGLYRTMWHEQQRIKGWKLNQQEVT